MPLPRRTIRRVRLRSPKLAALLRSLARAALLGAIASTARAEGTPSTAPAIDLHQIWLGSSAATARLENGGRAELTLDLELQRTAQTLLARARPRRAAAVAIDAHTGQVLVWAEYPANASGPSLLTHAIAPAASVLKVITSAALLERSHVSPNERVCISGGLHGIERQHLEEPQGGAFCTSFGLALGHSRNAVYAQLVTRHLLRQDLLDVATRFGLNAPLPFDANALMGTLELPYNDLEFARAATGFRKSALSALGAAYLAYIVANDGRKAALHIVRSAPSYAVPEQKELLEQVIEPETARTLTRMMEVTVRTGTSSDAFVDETGRSYLPGIRVAGKTGTLRPSGSPDTTSWFIGFAPSRSPEIVVSVVLENKPLWHRKAKSVARDVLRAYFAERGRKRVTHPLSDEPIREAMHEARAPE